MMTASDDVSPGLDSHRKLLRTTYRSIASHRQTSGSAWTALRLRMLASTSESSGPLTAHSRSGDRRQVPTATIPYGDCAGGRSSGPPQIRPTARLSQYCFFLAFAATAPANGRRRFHKLDRLRSLTALLRSMTRSIHDQKPSRTAVTVYDDASGPFEPLQPRLLTPRPSPAGPAPARSS